MVCAAISTDVWDWAVVEESSGLFDALSFHQPNIAVAKATLDSRQILKP
jgi:hypothetical protein